MKLVQFDILVENRVAKARELTYGSALQKAIRIAQEIASAVTKKSDRSTMTLKILSSTEFQKSMKEYKP